MKATIQIPDELYRRVKEKTVREGRTVREVTIGLFQQWVEERERLGSSVSAVDWRKHRAPLAHLVPSDIDDHSMSAVRESIVEKWNERS